MKIEPGSDTIKLTLSFHHRQILRLIAVRGGRIDFKFDSPFIMPKDWPAGQPEPSDEQKLKITKDSDASIRQMETMGLIRITPIIGHDNHELVLTDIGRNIIDQMGIPVVAGPDKRKPE